MTLAVPVYRSDSGTDLIVASGGLISIEAGGSFTSAVTLSAPSFTLSSPRWEDLRVPVTSTKLGGSKDPHFAKLKDTGTGSQGVFTYLFDKASEEELYFSVQLPHAWQEASTIKPHVHWCPIDTGVGTVRWGLEYAMADVGGTLGNTLIIYSTATAAPGVAYQHTLAAIGSGIAMTDMDVSCMILCRVFRDVGNDNYDNDAALLEIDFHYQVDTPGGSDAETSKS